MTTAGGSLPTVSSSSSSAVFLVRKVERILSASHGGCQRVVLPCEHAEFDQLRAAEDGSTTPTRSPVTSPAGDDELVGRGDQRSAAGRSARRRRGLRRSWPARSGVDATGAGQPAVLLQLVLAVAQVSPTRRITSFGVFPGQFADVQQITRRTAASASNSSLLMPSMVNRCELRDHGCRRAASLADRPVDRVRVRAGCRRSECGQGRSPS